jgi:hypothetical protein
MQLNKLVLYTVSLILLVFILAGSTMTKKIEPFICRCGCGETLRTKAAERRHMEGKGPLYIRYSQNIASSSQPDPKSAISSPNEIDLDPDYFDRHDNYLPMDVDETPGAVRESPHSDSESDDGFFAGEDEQDGGWDSDEESDSDADGEWDEGEEPWQMGLSQGDRLGAIFEAEAARAGVCIS